MEKERSTMYSAEWFWPSSNMDFWKIENDKYKVRIKWSHIYFEDYKKMAYDFYICGYSTFCEVINSGHDNIKSDMWFLAGIFLLRQSIELGFKALICRVCKKNSDIQMTFEECCHDLSALFREYRNNTEEEYLSDEEREWLELYINSLENVDEKSDMFRFPFEDKFLKQYRDKFLDNVEVANNMLQAFSLVKKCIEKGNVTKEDKFDNRLSPEFFVFANHGIGNCYLWQRVSDEGFHVKIKGYQDVADFIFNNIEINIDNKVYPLMFMLRNTLELCLKRLFYSRVDNGVPLHVFRAKRKSHLVKKDLWKNVKPVIMRYANTQGNDIDVINNVEKMIEVVNSLDKNGDNFRYPTSYSLEYRIDNVVLDLKNVYKYLRAISNFLDGCDSMLDAVVEYQDEMRAEYEADMRANMDWY